MKNKKEIEKSVALTPATPKTPSNPLNQKLKPGNIQISKIVTCQSIDDRRHMSLQTEFSVKKDRKVCVWTDVQSKQVPCAIKHVYFINGRRYRSIPLSIKHPQMRTWSYVSLNSHDDEGKWRVDVITDKEEILSRIEFSVVP